MNKRRTGLVIIAFAMALNITSAWADGLVAQTNTSKVAQGDTLQLTLTADGTVQAAPDLAPLSKDFDVLGTSQSSQTQIINGKRSQSISWIITLSPLNQGEVTIPSISAGSFSSEPLSLEVVDASELPKLQGADGISISATVEDALHYRFQEIPLTVRIESSQPLQSAQLSEPVGKFELTASGEARQSQMSRDGQLVNVIEQSYLLRPQVEGELDIAPFTLEGTVQDPDARNADPFASAFGGGSSFARMEQMMAQFGGGAFGGGMRSMFGPQGTPFVARTDVLNLTVEANPAGDSSNWFLPAKEVQIRGEWLADKPTFREGEAVSRRISVLALGARPEQLPDLTFADPDGARIYVDDIKTDTVSTADGTVAQRDFFISVVPTRAGEVVLPEISLDWLNTVNGESQTATLAAETLSVEGLSLTESAAVDSASADLTANTEASDNALASDDSTSNRQWWSVGAGIGIVAVLFAGWLSRRRRVSGAGDAHTRSGIGVNVSDDGKSSSADNLMNALRKSARRADTDAFYKTLLSIRQRVDDSDKTAIERAIAAIEQNSYAKNASAATPDLDKILKDLERSNISKKALRSRSTQLPPLYPSVA